MSLSSESLAGFTAQTISSSERASPVVAVQIRWNIARVPASPSS